MICAGIIGGSAIANFFFGPVIKESVQDNELRTKMFVKFFAITGALLIISGLANIFLIKGSKAVEGKNCYWYLFLFFKFCLALMTTPMAPKVFGIFGKEDFYWDNHTKIQFVFILLAYLLSTSAKWFREDVANNFVQNSKGKLD
ncbi:unnamed protein product [Moneuplotes crassus]|uniref:Uncharacterized protein n=1 Tax=Euplotes crassus TaxID=5936 RepID=A0AAD1Y2M6_EUPCR|nr:unnamed protein product [Moneuplotes crassus]